MSARPLVSVLLLLALMVERFASYGFRSQFVVVQLSRGIERSEVSAQYSTFTNLTTVLSFVFAFIAIAAPRVWMAPIGGLIALCGYLTAIAGPQTAFPIGVLTIAVGTAVTKVTIACAAADFVDSGRARTVVGVVAYGVINLGALVGPFATGGSADSFSRLPVVAAVSAFMLCSGALVLGRVLVRPPAIAAPRPKGFLGVLLLSALSAFLWVMVDSQPYDLDVPLWARSLNPLLLPPASIVLALVLGLVPLRALPWTVLAVLLLSLAFAGSAAVGIENRDPSTQVAVQVVLAMAEVGLGMLVYALMLGTTPPRFAPLAVAISSGTGAFMTNVMASQPSHLRPSLVLAFGAIGVVAFGVFSVLFRRTLGPLGYTETLGPVAGAR
jgi:hypothetical protein